MSQRDQVDARQPAPPSGLKPASGPLNIADLRTIAATTLPAATFDYLEGGAADERTLLANCERYARLRLAPRACVDVSVLDTSLELLGQRLRHPILLSPTASHGHFHPDAEAATVRGAAEAEALWTASTMSTLSVTDVGALTSEPFWFQLYVQRDRDFTEGLVRRAVAAGARAIVVTVDTPVPGMRERDARSGYVLPSADETLCVNLRGSTAVLDPRGVFDPRIDPTITWRTLAWLVRVAGVPVLAKGIVRPDDAGRAVDAGVAGVVVSNHGGRNLDTAVATIDALPGVVRQVAGAVPVLVDGGVRRGTDILKALALGATAVGIGRPYVWGLAASGASGVRDAVLLLRRELEIAMALCGAPNLAAVSADLIWREVD
jgi:4-hydroxymandelate oxidase